MLRVELSHRVDAGALHRGQRRPALQKRRGHRGTEIVARPLEGVRKVVFEGRAQLQRERRAELDRRAPFLDQIREQSRRGGLGTPGLQLRVMLHEQGQQEARIRRIVLGAARGEGFAEAPQTARIDRIEHDERRLEQRGDQRTAGGLERDRHRAAAEPGGQLGPPRRQGIGRVREPMRFDCITPSDLQRDVVVVIGPVDSHPSGDQLFRWSWHRISWLQ